MESVEQKDLFMKNKSKQPTKNSLKIKNWPSFNKINSEGHKTYYSTLPELNTNINDSLYNKKFNKGMGKRVSTCSTYNTSDIQGTSASLRFNTISSVGERKSSKVKRKSETPIFSGGRIKTQFLLNQRNMDHFLKENEVPSLEKINNLYNFPNFKGLNKTKGEGYLKVLNNQTLYISSAILTKKRDLAYKLVSGKRVNCAELKKLAKWCTLFSLWDHLGQDIFSLTEIFEEERSFFNSNKEITIDNIRNIYRSKKRYYPKAAIKDLFEILSNSEDSTKVDTKLFFIHIFISSNRHSLDQKYEIFLNLLSNTKNEISMSKTLDIIRKVFYYDDDEIKIRKLITKFFKEELKVNKETFYKFVEDTKKVTKIIKRNLELNNLYIQLEYKRLSQRLFDSICSNIKVFGDMASTKDIKYIQEVNRIIGGLGHMVDRRIEYEREINQIEEEEKMKNKI